MSSGRAISLRLAKDGFDVCVNDLESNWANVESVRHLRHLSKTHVDTEFKFFHSLPLRSV